MTLVQGERSTDRTLPDEAAGGSRPRRRKRIIVVVAITSALVSIGGLVAASFIKSPAQALADTRAPQPSVLTAPVVRRVLANTTVLRGTFTSGQEYPVQPTAVAATSGGPGGGALVVTGIKVSVGEQVRRGQVLAEVSGRPVFVLPGAIPVYRDMLPGESGEDIAQLQTDLRAVGISTGGDRAGWFGPGTKAAVTIWYQRIGYAVPVTGDTTQQAVQAAQQAVQQQQQLVQDLTSAPATTGTTTAGQSGGAKGSASAAPSATTSGASSADPAVQLQRARATLAQDETTLAQAEAKNGPELPASEVLFLPSFPARVESVSARVGDKVTTPVLQLTAGGLTLNGRLQPSDAPLVKAGMDVTVLDESTGVQAKGRVASIGALIDPSQTQGQSTAAPAAGAATTPYVPLVVAPAVAWDPSLVGHDVRLTIVAASTAGEVLAVPAAAVSSDLEGRTTVTVVTPGGAHRTVAVTAGVTADNYVQITPQGDALQAGDLVMVGR